MSNEIPRGRGIYILPTSITLIGLFAGFYSIVAATKGRFSYAAVAIFIAMLMDGLDGRVARLTNTETRFGAELDSITDMVTCGIAPALVVYFWSLYSLGQVGWLAAFIYMACVALRLARFNAKQQGTNKRFFQGLPSPSGAGVVAAMVWLGHDNAIYGPDVNYIVAAMSIFVGMMMVSSVPYRSFKDFNLRENVSFMVVVSVFLVFVLIAVYPPSVLFAAFFGYAVYGPLYKLFRFIKSVIN